MAYEMRSKTTVNSTCNAKLDFALFFFFLENLWKRMVSTVLPSFYA